MMYRFLFLGAADNGFYHCEHHNYACDTMAMTCAKHLLKSYPLAGQVFVYRFRGADTCGPMSYVATIER